MTSSFDKSFGQRVESWKSVFASFVSWAATMATKTEQERTVSYKPSKGKGSNDPPRTLTFAGKHQDAIIAALRLNAYDAGLINETELEKLDLWDSRTNEKGKVIGRKVGGRPIAEAIGIAKLLGCPVTSLPRWERKVKEGKIASFVVDVNADAVVRMLEAKAAALAATEAMQAAPTTEKKKNGK